MATSNFNSNQRIFTKKRGGNFLGGQQGGLGVLASVLGVVGFKQYVRQNKEIQRLEREEKKKQWHLSTQMHKEQKKIYKEQIKIFEDLAKAVGTTVDGLKSLPYDKLKNVAKYLGVEKTGLKVSDVEKHLKRKGVKSSDIKTFDAALSEVNDILSGLGLQSYDLRDVSSKETLNNMLQDPLKKIDFSILNPSNNEIGAIQNSSIGIIQEIAKNLNKDKNLLDTFKNTNQIDKNVQKIVDPMVNLLKHFGKGQNEIDSFIKHFLHNVEDLVTITNDEFKDMYEKLGGKTFLMTDKEKTIFENKIKKLLSSGLKDDKIQRQISSILDKLDAKEKREINKIKKIIKSNKGFDANAIKNLLEILKLNKQISEADLNNLRKDLEEKLKIVESGGELSESEKKFYTKQRFKFLNTIYDSVSEKTTEFLHSLGSMAIPLKAIIGFIAHTFHEVFTTIEQISETTGRFSKTLWGEFDKLKDEMDAIFYNRDFYAFKSNEKILKTSTELFRTQYSLFEQLGRSYAETDVSTLNKVALWQDVIGMTGDEVGGMLRVFRDIGNEGLEENLQQMTKIATFADSAGISTKQLFQEIGENSTLYARNMGTSVTEMVKLNAQLLRVGLSMKDIDRVMSGFDTVESMLEKSMKLSIFTGKNINFTAMTTAKMMGDLPRATEELRIQLNKFSDQEWFSSGFAFQKMQIAKELGMTEDELNRIRKGLTQAEKESAMMQQKIDNSFKESYQSFYENFRQIGLSKLKQYMEHYIINPLKELFTTYKDETKAIIDVMGWLMKHFGQFVVDLVRVVGGSLKWFMEFTGMNMTVEGKREKPNEKNSTASFSIFGKTFGDQKTDEGDKAHKSSPFSASLLGGLGVLIGGYYLKNKLFGNQQVYWLQKIYERLGGVSGGLDTFSKSIKDKIFSKIKTSYSSNPTKFIKGGFGVAGAIGLGIQFIDTYSTAFEGSLKTSWESKISSIVSGGTLGFMIGGPVGALIGAVVGVVGNEISHSIGKVNGQMEKIMKENPLLTEQEAFENARKKIREQNALYVAEASNSWSKIWRGMLAGLDEITMFFKNPKSLSSEHGFGVNTSHFTGLADGGIVTKATQAIIGEGKDNEAVIPLSSSRGKQMLQLDVSNESIKNLTSAMIASERKSNNVSVNINTDKINLSDESINKLALAIQKAQINVKVNVDNKGKIKLSRDEKELNYYKNSNSGLLDIETY